MSRPRRADVEKDVKNYQGPKKALLSVSKIYRVILNLYGDPPYKNQTSEKRYKVPTKALPPMRGFASLCFLNRHTFVCGSLFGGIKLIELYSPEQTSTYKSAILAEY